METLYIILLGAIGIIIAIGVGLDLSSGIDEFVIYLLFWLLYIVTIATFINIVLVINYYLTMKDKTGPLGVKGSTGDQGEQGDAGKCDPTCRDSICEKAILDIITDKLKNSLDDNGNKVVIDPKIRFNNIYIKSKVRQMCASDEFKQLAPYNGPQNLINYLKDIWSIWFDKLYQAGGHRYFDNVAAETEFDWLTTNPFQEIKQYDVFYWGMGKQYRPQIIDKCYDSLNGDSPDITTGSIVRASPTTLYDYLGNGNINGVVNYVSFWRARQYTYKGAVYYPVGDLAIGPILTNENISMERKVGAVTLNTPSNGPNRETIIVSGDVVGPISYDLVWTDDTIWLWRPIAPNNYISLGDVVTFNSIQPLTGEGAPIRCVSYDLTIRIKPNGNILWSSYGSKTPTDALILGFKPNDGSFVSSGVNSLDINCYNMFRTVVGLNSTIIPDSDINGGFYYLDPQKYDSDYMIGVDYGSPSSNPPSSKVGKGYLKIPKKDSKYSVLSYLNLKNNPVLIHQMSQSPLNGKLVQNIISNAYLITIGEDKCLNYDGNSVKIGVCDEYIESQIFNILFTGNKKNECKIQHYNTKHILKYKNSLFTLVDKDDQNDNHYKLFTMQ